jgi:hypothetical protein
LAFIQTAGKESTRPRIAMGLAGGRIAGEATTASVRGRHRLYRLALLAGVVRKAAVVVDRRREMLFETVSGIAEIIVVDGDRCYAVVEKLLQPATNIRRLRIIRVSVRQGTPNREPGFDSHVVILLFSGSIAFQTLR